MNKKLIIKNIGVISDMEITIDKPLILFYGEIKSGKTTILNAIKLLFGGSYPKDIIKHGEQYGFVHFILGENSSIRREFYIKEGKVKDRPIQYIKDGELLSNPVSELKKLTNPFLIDQDFFNDKKAVDKAKYLVELFNVDTSELDGKIKNLDDKNKTLRIEIKAYGDINPVEREEPKPINDLIQQKDDADDFNQTAKDRETEIERKKLTLSEYDRQIAELQEKKKAIEKWLEENPTIDEIDITSLSTQIQQHEANKLLYDQYIRDKKRLDEKEKKEKELKENEKQVKLWRTEKLKKLAELNENVNIPGFEFTEEGSFIYENTAPDMLSTSQQIELSAKLSSLYPNELKLELIDRAESLGTSVFEHVKRAEENELSILAAIVGEKEADIPENIGVFIVDNGELKK
jgi:DNA repair exonuclease SbcCD ATPase subunit